MHAVVITKPGGPEVLQWTEVDDPVPGQGEVLVDVVAGIEDAGGAAGRELHRILKFPAKSGPWRGPSRMMQIERFGVEFIRQVLGGQNAEQGARRSGTP